MRAKLAALSPPPPCLSSERGYVCTPAVEVEGGGCSVRDILGVGSWVSRLDKNRPAGDLLDSAAVAVSCSFVAFSPLVKLNRQTGNKC